MRPHHHHTHPHSLITFDQHDLDHLRIFNHQLVIACSGGVDSVVLLDQLCHLSTQYPHLKLKICHINFHLRADESRQAADFVHKLAQHYNLDLLNHHPYPRYQSTQSHSHQLNDDHSFELWARAVKTTALHLAQSRGMCMAMAHHRDDLTETIIMRILRGSQPWHLKGLRRWHQGIFRPLLAITKPELIAYAHHHSLKWHEDTTNQDPKITRNYIRHHLIPTLTTIQPTAPQHLITHANTSEQLKANLRNTMITTLTTPRFWLHLNNPHILSSATSLLVALEILTKRTISMTTKQLNHLFNQLSQPARTPHAELWHPLPPGWLFRKNNYLTYYPTTITSPPNPRHYPQHYDLWPYITLTTQLKGYHHHTTLSVCASQRITLTIQPAQQYLKSTQPSLKLTTVMRRFNQQAVNYDIFPQISQNLLFICQHDQVLLALSPTQIYRITTTTESNQVPQFTFHHLCRDHTYQWQLQLNHSSQHCHGLMLVHHNNDEAPVKVNILPAAGENR